MTTATDPFITAIPGRVESVMGRRCLSLNAVARASGIPRQTLARRLRSPGDFYPREVQALAAALEVPDMFLLCGEEVGM